MTIATVEFPTSLPAPLIQNYTMSPDNVFIRNAVSDGPPRYRLRTPRYTTIFGVEWHLSEFQFQTFRLWFDSFAELNFNRWFTINLAVGLAVSATAPRTLQQLQCHFFEDWEATIDDQSNDWRLRATLEARFQAAEGATERIISADSIVNARPVDIIDARSITEERPTDIINSATPSFWS